MKVLLATAGVFAALSLAACGGSGHSDAYNKGFKWANDNPGLTKMQSHMIGASNLCGEWAVSQAQGLNAQEWIQGCTDALSKKS
jgi:hypothetical protein